MLVRTVLAAAALAVTVAAAAAVARAEELAPPPDATRTRLLNEVPNFPQVLKDQWSRAVPSDTFDAERGNYGLLNDHAAPRPITLEESIALALQNNTGLRIEKLSPIAASNRVRAAYAQFDPFAFGGGQKQRTNTPSGTLSPFTTDAGAGGFPPPDLFNQEATWNLGVGKKLLTGGALQAEWTNARLFSNPNVINLLVPSYSTTLGLTLNQPLLRDFGWRFALLVVDVAQISEEAAFYDYKEQVSTLVENVERAYWAYVLAIENVRVEVKGLDLAKELLRQNEGRFKVGSLPRTAVLESEAEVARREADLVRSRALERIARDNLRALVNAKQGTDSLLMIEPADKPGVPPVDLDLDQSLKVAYTQRPELIAARLNVDGSRVQRKIAENKLLPRFDFVGSLGLNGLGGDNSGIPPSQFGRVNPQVLGGYGRSLELLTDGRYYQYLFGARLEIPIDNAAAKADYAQAKINTESARLSLEQLEENVTLEITQSVNNLKALLKSIEATRIARELAEENVRNQQARYDVGLATTKDLIDFTDRLTQAQQAEIESLTLYNTELARLRLAKGSLLEDRNVELDRAAPEQPAWWAQF
jgi:outer membrane protein